LIHIVLKSSKNDFSKAQKLIKENYQGAYKNKVEFAKWYAGKYLFSEDLSPHIVIHA
jgi:hypothetical protein